MAAPRPASTPSAASPPVTVRGIGADGDGLAVLPDGTELYLPYTLPGEVVQPGPLVRRGRGFAGTAAVIEASADRVAPPCPHFGVCGGCSLQHWRDAPYAAWKAGQVAAALQMPSPPAMTRTPPHARRRIELAVRREGPRILIGLHRWRSDAVVDMHACPILHPALFALVQALRPVLLRLAGLRRAGSVLLNLLESGPDVLLRTDHPLSSGDRTLLAGLAQAHGVPRVSWAPAALRGAVEAETACQLRPATTSFAGVPVQVPPGAFLQASAEGEQAIAAAVLAALPAGIPARKPVIELFAGCGSITHAIAAKARVEAYEGDAAAVAALRQARNPRVTVHQRDLARQPLRPEELKHAGAIVLDPPFGGAPAQMAALGGSGVPIVYVSCNPAALTRDWRLLAGQGYRVASVAVIDQFLWSARVESVACFLRGS